MDKEAIARVERADEILGEKLCALSATLPLFGFFSALENAETYEAAVAAKQALSTAILALQSSERGEGDAKRYAAELREIAGMLAQCPDGPVRWKQYRLGAIADFLATLSPAEPSPESREDFYANLYARSCGDVLRVRAETIEECAKVAEATTDDPPESMYEHAYDHAAHHIAAQIRALSAPAHD